MIIGLAKMLHDNFQIDIKNYALFDEAFTHASYVNEHPKENLKYYERIEFLGDAVMQLCVSEYLFKRYPNLPEGKLSRLRAAMVCEDSFSKFAKECHFDEYIRLGKGEEKANARNRPSLLCDIFEAFIGALYLDQGKETVVSFISKVIFPKLDMGWFDHFLDHKTELQELLQQDGDCEIEYQVLAAKGPDNAKQYYVAVLANQKELGRGMGHTKKAAEQAAANQALKELRG
ncbi:ribonuclease III [Ligilactobacillus agilis]|uniref:Ribonuclease 3 n=1 Tax=Ligilactobacillus agilis TaxID=1601 RepID=A0A6F9XT72_9LACO|nr:ribonuclease III [Ligilactobacillus agilis]MBM6762507.1 ribonuclease III [Ligilactobacillus agilis]MBM6772527.1 ribonuclease III [Ligilactobacillus agilis]GET08340.1 ribonuclease III [Ligilactobacillus agilis]